MNFPTSLNKDKITEMLDQRNKRRQLEATVAHLQRHKDSAETEHRDYFDQSFETKTREIKNNLNNLQESGDKSDLGQAFNQIVHSIQQLQSYVSNSTLFLTEYKIKTCQSEINELHVRCEELKQKLVPKKKFGFKSKKTTPPIGTAASALTSIPVDIPPREVAAAGTTGRKEFEATVSGLKNKVIRIDDPSIVNGKDLTFRDLENCWVEIVGAPGSLQMVRLRNCIVLTGPVARSIYVDMCMGNGFAFACQQMRLHSSWDCDIYLHVTCRGIIEDCKRIRVAPYNWSYPGIEQDFVAAGLNHELNNWQDIADFNWLSPELPSPNWTSITGDGEMVASWDKEKSVFLAKQDGKMI